MSRGKRRYAFRQSGVPFGIVSRRRTRAEHSVDRPDSWQALYAWIGDHDWSACFRVALLMLIRLVERVTLGLLSSHFVGQLIGALMH
jgi:hypothetical protein